MEPMSNSDLADVTLRFYANVLGCGWCGARSIGDWPDCCPKMAEWKRCIGRTWAIEAEVRRVEVYEPSAIPELEPLRWPRCVRRWSCKHRPR